MGGWARQFSSCAQPVVVPLLMGKIHPIIDAQTAWLSYAVFAWDKLGLKKTWRLTAPRFRLHYRDDSSVISLSF